MENKNNVESLMFISYALKTFQLTIVILNISYILGMIWYIILEFVQDFVYDIDYRDLEDPTKFEPENFVNYFELYSKSE